MLRQTFPYLPPAQQSFRGPRTQKTFLWHLQTQNMLEPCVSASWEVLELPELSLP